MSKKDNVIDGEILMRDYKSMTREERRKYADDLFFSIKCDLEGIAEEDRADAREEFDIENERERRLNRLAVDVLIGNGDKLTPFERKQAEKYIKENPETEVIFEGLVNMICEGADAYGPLSKQRRKRAGCSHPED